MEEMLDNNQSNEEKMLANNSSEASLKEYR